MEKFVYYFGDGKAEGNRTMKDTLGGKGSGLAEMTNAGLPVPPGFTISTGACNLYYDNGGKLTPAIETEIERYIARLEKSAKATLGSSTNPLLVSVRSGAKFSMPGMMDTVLNLGLNDATVEGLVPYVDRQMIMTYNYRWSGSTRTGAIAPLDNTTRTVKIHIAKMLQWAPAGRILMGVPYYGYDWPVTSTEPNATVQADKATYGPVKSVTYASARDFLAARPEVVRQYDALEGSGFYTYWSAKDGTYRQVYFEEERSLAAKYDYAIATGLAGVGIWTLGNDGTYPQLRDVLRSKFYAPVRQISVGGRIAVRNP